VRFLTLNIWNYTPPWEKRRELIVDLLTSINPDVACLQETRRDFRFDHGVGQGEQIARLAGMHATSHVAQVYWPFPRVEEGLTILTRVAPERTMFRELTQLSDEREDENRRICLGVCVQGSSGPVHVLNTHFSLGDRARVLNACETHAYAVELGEGPVLLFGDFNCNPESAPIRYLLGELGVEGETGDFVDCWASCRPDDRGYTYASWRPYHRIDFALARGLNGRVTSVELAGTVATDGLYPSDHLGIVIDVEV
jgi:endonuclease/exonuclease/phosphatase family metal-dependent hydrolase